MRRRKRNALIMRMKRLSYQLRRKTGFKELTGGTWNVRRLGAWATAASAQLRKDSMDPVLKVQCILHLMLARRWDFACLTDLQYNDNGVREFLCQEMTFTLVIRGRVGIMMTASLTAQWRMGGAKVLMQGRQDRKTTRCMCLFFRASAASAACLWSVRMHRSQIDSTRGIESNSTRSWRWSWTKARATTTISW